MCFKSTVGHGQSETIIPGDEEAAQRQVTVTGDSSRCRDAGDRLSL